jgi:hypothetical protein
VFAQNMHPDSVANLQSVTLLNSYITRIKNFYAAQGYGCDSALLAVNEIKPASIGAIVYPNPSTGKFNIKSSVNSRQSLVEVYNMIGEKILSQLATYNSPLTINLADQPNGVYFYRLLNKDNELVASGKLMLAK